MFLLGGIEGTDQIEFEGLLKSFNSVLNIGKLPEHFVYLLILNSQVFYYFDILELVSSFIQGRVNFQDFWRQGPIIF